jgi:hypothetical protein
MKDKKEKEKEKPNNYKKDETLMKNYRVPDALNKKNFDKINIYNLIGITKFMNFCEAAEMSFVNQKMYNVINQHYYKKMPMIKTSISTLKKIIFIKFSEDFRFYLEKNSVHMREIIRKIIESLVVEYFPKLGIKTYFFSRINFNTHITKILLNNCDIGKKSMKYLSFYFYNPNCEIKYLDISGNKINGEILAPLEKNKDYELDCILADKCIIDNKTINILSKIKTKKLSLANNNIDSELIEKLMNNYINELNVANNCILSSGVFNICKNMPNLTKLNLSNNNLCDLSIMYLCLYIKNPKNKLISLKLKDNKITIKGMILLISTLDFVYKEIKNINSFKKLNLSGNLLDYVNIPKTLGTDFVNLNLEKLNLSNHSFSLENLNTLFDFINNIKNIKVLDLSKTVFDQKLMDLVFNRVSKNKSLKKLKLKNCYLGHTELNKENNNGTNNIKKEEEEKKDNNNNINNNEINDSLSNKNLFNQDLGIESLDLGYNYILFKQLNDIIISNKIKELNIEGNDLYIWGNDLYLFFDLVLENKFLEKLNLRKNNLRKMGNEFLEKIYNYNNENNKQSNLKYLSLEDNQIQDINKELTNLLSNNKNLEVLNLENNLINDELGNNDFFHSLFKNKNSNIKEINLSNNKISLEFIDKLIKYSKENELEKTDFILNITSIDIRNAYLNKENKTVYWDLIKLNCVKCF